MAITVTLKGSDLKFSNGTSIEYYPVSQVKQKVVGTNIEIWRGGELVRSDDASDYSSPSGTAEAIGDAISVLTQYSVQIQGKDPSGNIIDLNANEVGDQITSEINFEIEKGNVENHSHVVVAASNVDIDTGPETIWKHTGLWTPMATARTMSIVSDDANDTSAGTGARTLLVQGVDATGAAQVEVVTMTGTTPVVTVNTWLGINPSLVLTAGSSTYNEGNITFTSTTDNEVQTVIAPEDALSSAMIYHVPINTNYYLKFIRSAVYKSSGADADVVVDGYVITNGVRYNIYEVDLVEAVMPVDALDLNSYSLITGGSCFYFEATSDKNNTQVRVAFEGILVAD